MDLCAEKVKIIRVVIDWSQPKYSLGPAIVVHLSAHLINDFQVGVHGYFFQKIYFYCSDTWIPLKHAWLPVLKIYVKNVMNTNTLWGLHRTMWKAKFSWQMSEIQQTTKSPDLIMLCLGYDCLSIIHQGGGGGGYYELGCC